ncbi:hypothetical protein J6590_030809 [Homalodisca vitripennis]|nr:hypothetical protein J6590_030809 [Homalodisca vitripennis]
MQYPTTVSISLHVLLSDMGRNIGFCSSVSYVLLDMKYEDCIITRRKLGELTSERRRGNSEVRTDCYCEDLGSFNWKTFLVLKRLMILLADLSSSLKKPVNV